MNENQTNGRFVRTAVIVSLLLAAAIVAGIRMYLNLRPTLAYQAARDAAFGGQYEQMQEKLDWLANNTDEEVYYQAVAEFAAMADYNGDHDVALELLSQPEPADSEAYQRFAAEAEEQEAELAELREYVEEIDSDVGDLEEVLLSLDDDDDEDDDDFDDDEDDEDDDELIEYECPHCGTVIFFDGEAFDMEEDHLCPNCHRSVFEEDEDDAQEDDEE